MLTLIDLKQDQQQCYTLYALRKGCSQRASLPDMECFLCGECTGLSLKEWFKAQNQMLLHIMRFRYILLRYIWLLQSSHDTNQYNLFLRGM